MELGRKFCGQSIKSELYETADCGEEMLSGNTWKIAMRVIFYIRLV